MAIVARFLDVEEAQLAKALLDSSGVRTHIVDERMAGLSWHLLPALGGVRLEVSDEQVEEARAVLQDATKGRPAPDPVDVSYFRQRAVRRRRYALWGYLLFVSPWLAVAGWLLGRFTPRRNGPSNT